MSQRRHWAWILVAAVSGLAAGAAPVAAQLQTGDLYGSAQDEGGQPLPGVTVTLRGIGAPRVQVSDEQGGFRFLGLFPGVYSLTAELAGYSTLEYPDIAIRVGGKTELELVLSAAVQDVITVTGETPLLDARQTNRGATVAAAELDSVPTARDPWSLLALAPGVQVDRVNVGGNESGQQSTFLGVGASGTENTFAVDGMVLTDMAAVGGSATYFDFGAYEEVQFTVSSADVTIATAGVTINQVTKRGTNQWRVEGRYLRTDGDLQSEPTVVNGNKIDSVEEYGGNLGGPLLKDRLWAWGSYGESDIRNLAPDPGGEGRLADRTVLEDLNLKMNFQATPANSGVLHYWTNDKLKFGRVFTFIGNPLDEATHDQTTPQDIYKLEDTHLFGANFSLTVLWAKDEGSFTLKPHGGLEADVFTDADFILHGSSFDFEQEATIEQGRVDANYYFTTGSVNHDLKFGAGFREQENHSITVWPRGRNTTYYDGALAIARFPRNRVLAIRSEYESAWLQDTLTVDRWTIAAGVRFDRQGGENLASTSPENPQAQGFVPELVFQGNDGGDLEWENLVPRLSVTRSFGEERRTLARATFSRYAQQLGQNYFLRVNPAGGYSYAYFYFADANGNVLLDPDEIPSLYFGYTYNINPDDPGSLVSANVNDPDLEPEMTDEITFGLERGLRANLAAGLTLTWRSITDTPEERGLVVDPVTGLVRPWTRADFELSQSVTGPLPDGSTSPPVPVFGLREGIESTGGFLLTNGDSEQNYFGVTGSFTRRLSHRWSARGHVTWSDWEWDVGPGTLLHDDPTNTVEDDLTAGDGNDVFTEQADGAKADIFVGSRWSFALYGLYQVAPDSPWGFNVAASLSGREGYANPPVFRAARAGLGRALTEMTRKIDQFRNDDIVLLDARVEKEFTVGEDLALLVGVDGFNLLDEDYVLQRDRRLDLGGANVVRERVSPRVFRLGLTLRWR
jgi:hypothetical protein